MKNLNRLRGALTMCVLAAGSTVYAQQAEPTLTDPPQAPQCEAPPAECPMPQAQPAPPPPPPHAYTPPPEPVAYAQPHEEWYNRIGFGLALGGGVDDFVADDIRDFTNIGGGWTLRATLGTRTYLGFEGSYIGSAQSIDALGLDDDATLFGNGLQGAVRLNILPHFYASPFLYGGAAWRHYDVSSDGINTSDVRDSDDVFEVPVGIGISGTVSDFLADVRAEYRGAWGDDLVPNIDDDNAIIGELDRWSVSASIGMTF